MNQRRCAGRSRPSSQAGEGTCLPVPLGTPQDARGRRIRFLVWGWAAAISRPCECPLGAALSTGSQAGACRASATKHGDCHCWHPKEDRCEDADAPVRSWKSLTLSVMREVPAAICNWRRSSPRRLTQRGSSCVLQPASLAAATHTTRPAATHRRRRLDEQSSTRHTTCLWKGGTPPHRSRRSPRGPKWLDRPSTTPSATRPPSCMP